jgi:phage/plasmid-associated DNA primase
MDVGWLQAGRKSNGPDSALADTKQGRKIWTAELVEEAELRMDKIKELTTETISGNEKHEKQDSWKVNANIVMGTNHDPRIKSSDYGTWRRILYYKFKRLYMTPDKFDGNNPNHRKANSDIMKKWIYDPNYQRAYLSIMVHFYEIFHSEYKGLISAIPKAEIDFETKEYQKRQDTITQFISDRIHFIGTEYDDGSKVDPISVRELVHKYITWFRRTISDQVHISKQETAIAFKDHNCISKFIEIYGREPYLIQHRILEIDEDFKDVNNNPSGNAAFENEVETGPVSEIDETESVSE